MKKFLIILSMFFTLSLVTIPVLAQNVSNPTVVSTKTSTADKIACVRTAVTVRENAIETAISVHAQAIHDAYATRAIELDGAYSNTNVKAVQAGVKVSWADFNKSVKSASAKWKTSRNTAWSTYRTAVKVCKAPSGVSDSANSSFEMNGQ